MTPHYHYIALSFVDGIGAVNAKNLISYCGSAEAIFKESKNTLLKIPGIGEKTVSKILSSDVKQKTEDELAFVEKYKIKILAYTDADFPQRLNHCADAPLLLYQKGKTSLNPNKVISIVGTRKATRYGKDFVSQLLEDLKGSNIQIVSGMALGIDGQAHKMSLENELDTIGILGHGLNNMYPASHKKLAKDMLEQGSSLVTECNSQEKMVPGNFPRRNRIIAGMSDAVIVIESAKKGGAVITANLANGYNRDVFSLAGRYKDKYSEGCNFLIKSHRAQLIDSAADLLQQLGWQEESKGKKQRIQKELMLDFSPSEQKIVNVLQENDEVGIEKLISKTAMSSGLLAAILLELELKGIVYSLPGNKYSIA